MSANGNHPAPFVLEEPEILAAIAERLERDHRWPQGYEAIVRLTAVNAGGKTGTFRALVSWEVKP